MRMIVELACALTGGAVGRKRAKNLLLDDDALRAAEAWCGQTGTSLSMLVNDYLERFPGLNEPRATATWVVQRLKGAAGPVKLDTFRDFLYVRQDETREKRRLKRDDVDDLKY